MRQAGRYDYARHALEVWAIWTLAREELGWPSEAVEARAMRLAAGATRTDGIAKWGKQEDPPTFPKETKPAAGPQIPPVDSARLGPRVERLLQDMELEGKRRWAIALRLSGLSRRMNGRNLASLSGMKPKAFYDAKHRGMRHLNRMLIEWEKRT